MRKSVLLALVLAAGLILASGCGGGGGGPFGGGPVTTSDVGGTWLGPTGTATPAGMLTAQAGTGGMTIDGAGNAAGTGTLAGLTGVITDEDPNSRLLAFTGGGGSAGTNGFLMVSSDKNHLLFIANDGTFGAWQRGAPGLVPPYQNADFRISSWLGYAVEVDGAFNSAGAELVFVDIDPAGNFSADTASTNAIPLFVFDTNTGEIQGDFIDPGPPAETGNLLAFITPDRQFMAVMSCATGAAALTDCGWVALERD